MRANTLCRAQGTLRILQLPMKVPDSRSPNARLQNSLQIKVYVALTIKQKGFSKPTPVSKCITYAQENVERTIFHKRLGSVQAFSHRQILCQSPWTAFSGDEIFPSHAMHYSKKSRFCFDLWCPLSCKLILPTLHNVRLWTYRRVPQIGPMYLRLGHCRSK